MTRMRMIILSLLAVFAISAIASGSASAACYQVATAGTGEFESPLCAGVAGTKEYVKVSKLEKELVYGEWCAKVEVAGAGTFEDNKCTVADKTNEFIKVLTGPPLRPTFWHFGAPVGGAGLPAEAKSGVSRLWATEVGVVVVCKEDTASAITLEPAGKDKATEVAYRGCVPVKPEKNAHEQWEEGEPLANCGVKSVSPVGAAGEIETNELASELVWTEKPEKRCWTGFHPKQRRCLRK